MMRCPMLVVLCGLAATAPAAASSLQTDNLLADPGSYSFTPSALPSAGTGLHGVVSTSVGSGGMRGTAIQINSGLIGRSTHAFLELGTGQGPAWATGDGHKLRVSGSDLAVGVTTELPYGTSLTVVVGEQHDRLGVR